MITGQQRNEFLSITDAIRDIFGINSPIFIPYEEHTPYEADPFSNIRILPEDTDEIETFSEFGLPILGSITFEGGQYNTYNRITGAVERARYGDYTLPASCVVEFSRNSNVTKTNVLGNRGTVKEIFGLEDWNISIKGLALTKRDGSGTKAQEQIDTLIKWANVCDAIGVEGSIFRRKEIYNLVIESISIQPIAARWNAIPFVIEAVSDEPIELYLL